ncbi:unnamed protein product, partial [Trichogramma brassicae]
LLTRVQVTFGGNARGKGRYHDDGFAEMLFRISKKQRRLVQIDVQDKLGRTPLQLAVANLLPNVVDALLNHGADLSNFSFPTVAFFTMRCNPWIMKLGLASLALIVIERLGNKGYEMQRADALTIMNLFANHRLFDNSVNLQKCWHDDDEFVKGAKKIKSRTRPKYDAGGYTRSPRETMPERRERDIHIQRRRWSTRREEGVYTRRRSPRETKREKARRRRQCDFFDCEIYSRATTTTTTTNGIDASNCKYTSAPAQFPNTDVIARYTYVEAQSCVPDRKGTFAVHCDDCQARDTAQKLSGGATTTTTESLPRSICNNDHSGGPDKSVRRSSMSRSEPLQSLDIFFRPPAAATTFRYFGKTYVAAWSTRPRWNLQSTNMATGTNNGKVRTRAQVEQFKQRMEALVRLEAPSMVWAKIRELPIQAVMEKLQQRRLSISGDEETLRVRLFRARCKALPNSNQLDVPWDPETDEEPEQDEKSLNETILQTKKPRDGDRPSAGRWCTTGADGGCVHPADDRGTHGDDRDAKVGIAVAQEIAKLSRGEASADAGGTSAGLGLRSSPSRDSGLTPKIRKPPRKMPRKMVTVEDRDMEEVQETSTPWDPKTPLGLLPGRLGVNEEPSDESESDSEREPVNWRGRQTQRSWPKTEPAMVTPTDHVRAEQRWKWARMLREIRV